ncbi:MAG: aldehyde dehydrogenase family protein [Gammaproteobacteria bacterium]|nr:aldehyde dehydrogenase family protein [Gammaproteobacteria bacterium]
MNRMIKSVIAAGAEATGSLRVFAPFDQKILAEVEQVGLAGIEQALTAAEDLFQRRSAWLSIPTRVQILETLGRLMSEQAAELALLAAQEGGKPLLDSQLEVARAIDSVRIAVETLRTESGRTVPMGINAASSGKLAFTQREPIGVVVAISAFNHPLNLIAHQVAPAIAAGCPVIVKPAEETPLSCFRFVELLHQAGLPEGWCQVLLTESRTVSTALVSDARVAFLSFIGSAKVGWMLRSKLAAGTRCALEHGGVAPVIVAEDADLESVVEKVLKGGFYHAGQVCVSVQRLFVQRSIARSLAERLAEKAAQLRVGDPTDAETEVGPLIRATEVVRIGGWVDEAVKEGAELLTGGKALSASCYACTVLYEPDKHSRVSREEIFGPVICVYPYDELSEAIEEANSLPYAFQAAMFTSNLEQASYAYRHLNASAVMVNDHTAFRVDWMPFAGLRQSGLGVGGVPYTLREMQIEKMMVWHSDHLV